MSSAILYAAIIAIWLGVLIPRWLRRDTSQTKAADTAEPLGQSADRPLGGRPAEVAGEPLGGRSAAEAGDGGTDVQMADAEHETAEPDEVEDPVEDYPVETDSRVRVLAARRRMLIMLGSLTVVALGMVAVHLAAWWVALPPIAMLGGYMMLLREASRMDAEHALLRADADYHEEKRAERAAARAAAAVAARAEAERVEAERRREEEQSARIIDISGRVKDELYDQYADEKRAVGD